MRAISPAWRQARWKLHDLTIVCQKPTQSPGTGINVSPGTSFKYAGSIIEKDRCQLLELGLVKYSWNLSLALEATRPNWLQSPDSFILEKKEKWKKIVTIELENGKKKNEANRSNAKTNNAVAIRSIRRKCKKIERITKKATKQATKKWKKKEGEKFGGGPKRRVVRYISTMWHQSTQIRGVESASVATLTQRSANHERKNSWKRWRDPCTAAALSGSASANNFTRFQLRMCVRAILEIGNPAAS